CGNRNLVTFVPRVLKHINVEVKLSAFLYPILALLVRRNDYYYFLFILDPESLGGTHTNERLSCSGCIGGQTSFSYLKPFFNKKHILLLLGIQLGECVPNIVKIAGNILDVIADVKIKSCLHKF